MKQQNEKAVSPVVGVMLMLIVVIIIAAVVSGFAGGLVGGKNQKTPQLDMDVSIANSGYWSTSYLKAEVTGVDAPIATRSLQIVTSWTHNFNNGTVIKGGATTTPGVVNFNAIYSTHGSFAYDLWRYTAPQGYGTGVGQNSSLFGAPGSGGNIFWIVDGHGTEYNLMQGTVTNNSWWGNFNLQAGTDLLCRPFGGSNYGQTGGTSEYTVGYGVGSSTTSAAQQYQYVYGDVANSGTCAISMIGGSNPNVGGYGGLGYPAVTCSGAHFYPYPTGSNLPDPEPTALIPSIIPGNSWDPTTYSIDQMQGVLGGNWFWLRPGDDVHMKIIYMPTGKVIWEKDIIVQGSVV